MHSKNRELVFGSLRDRSRSWVKTATSHFFRAKWPVLTWFSGWRRNACGRGDHKNEPTQAGRPNRHALRRGPADRAGSTEQLAAEPRLPRRGGFRNESGRQWRFVSTRLKPRGRFSVWRAPGSPACVRRIDRDQRRVAVGRAIAFDLFA